MRKTTNNDQSLDELSLEELEQLLQDFYEQIKQNDNLNEKLADEIRERETDSYVMDTVFFQSIEVVREIENGIKKEVLQVHIDAEKEMTAKVAELKKLDQLIFRLEGELLLYRRLVRQEGLEPEKELTKEVTVEANEELFLPEEKIEKPSLKDGGRHPGVVEDIPSYAIKLVSFINARHYVSLETVTGSIHAHSYQVQVEVRVSFSNEIVPFAKILETVRTALAAYEDVLLNEVHPFNQIQPTTENMAMVFFNILHEIFKKSGFDLLTISLWETPVKGIKVSTRNPNFDAIIKGEKKVVPTPCHKPTAKTDQVSAISSQVSAIQNQEPAPVRSSSTVSSTTAPIDIWSNGRDAKTDTTQSALTPRSSRKKPRKLLKQYSNRYPAYQYLLAALAITGFALLAYWGVLTAQARLHYPWGSDTWGHLFKAEFLYGEILRGNYFPQFTEYWYSGSQPFRYWAPLPYYILAFLRPLSADIFFAGNYYVFFCALLGGLSWLLYANRLGLPAATAGGIIWTVWLDNVRVAFSEGNLPRTLAAALLPLLLAAFLRLLEERRSVAAFIFTTQLSQ